MQPINEAPEQFEDQEQAFSSGYKKAYDDLIASNWNPRKARKHLDAICKKNLKKYLKDVKKNRATNSIKIEE